MYRPRRRKFYRRYVRRPYSRTRTARSLGLRRTGGNYNALIPRPLAGGGFRTGPGPELKFFDQAFINHLSTIGSSVGLLASPMYITCLNAIVPGTDSSNRIGRKVTMRGLNLNFSFGAVNSSNIPTTSTAGSVRVLIIADRQSNGGPYPTYLDIFSDDSIADGAPLVTAQLNPNNRERFYKLYDRTKVCNPGSSNAVVNFRAFKRLALPVIFNSVVGNTLTTIQTNALHLVLLHNVNETIVTTVSFSLGTRVFFSDE